MGSERTTLIAPLASTARADEIGVRIAEAIQLGLLSDGERLPPEAELAQQFGVSPVTLREALASLRDRGLVETRRGRRGGTFVRRSPEPDESGDLKRLADIAVTSLRDFADEQMAIAGMCAVLAAERATPDSVRRILKLVDQLASATTRGQKIKADSRFHIQVAIETRSERLTRRQVALQAETVGMLWTSHLPQDDIAHIAQEHHDIATAIAEEDRELARSHAERHVRSDLRRLTSMHLTLVDGAGGDS
ncbi:GntR family transcriptional repressor for pyruvate dehydrogenase complex [Mycobacterium frederiksbergense]|uniref:GntR family transcriptional repressor for pyruvate dehydrogenase complex n=1 Tax=Mycolicibacterium frederiksbergense TaxID=117567 RepID=A0ABT6L6G3_9MYCO|nr:GntR family transcriptional regulator [Mycolicibacterium frederiksbergense]MDH6198552.1 GntR family transcriptional repressor for pyruvate dehydrogenase complex [Mycolicibacterium frederiksbergense]